MRTWGRVANPGGGAPLWVEVSTDPTTGLNDRVYLTTLCQVLLLNLGESPFYASQGIPAQQAVSQQVPPDYYVALTQQNFAGYFASLNIQRTSPNVPGQTPTYEVSVTTNQGIVLNASVPVPT